MTVRYSALKKRSAGMVLIAVLWMVVALSLLVTGMTRSVRAAAKITSTAQQLLEGKALGEAAIQLSLQQMAARPVLENRLRTTVQTYMGVAINVEAQPLNGLIDLNAASEELLTNLFETIGGLALPQARNMAQSVMTARARPDQRGAPVRFEAVEDLLAIPGVSYGLYAKVQKLLTTDLRGGGKVNPLAAPDAVLLVLAKGNESVVSSVLRDRSTESGPVNTASFNPELVETNSVRRFLMTARVPLVDGSVVLAWRTVDISPRPRDGTPWHTFSTGHSLEPVQRSKLF